MNQNAVARRVLIVDDSATSRMITRRCFEMASTRPSSFIEAADGAAALTLLQDNEIDLIVTDINMPKMDGMTFVWKVRMNSRFQATPIIVLSSMKNERMQSTLDELGVTRFIQKPLSPAKVAEFTGEPV